MIIYFDFNLSKVKLLQQQNEKKYFVVDFLNEYVQKKDFESIINLICTQNDEIYKILRKEKNYVVLPNSLVGINSIIVPYSRKGANKYLTTKFDLIYNNAKDLKMKENLYFTDKTISMYTFVATKDRYIDSIYSNFEKLGVKLVGISFYASAVKNFVLSKQKSLAKENVVVAYFGDEICLSAISKGEVVCNQLVDGNKNDFAKKYVSFIENNYTKLSEKEIDIDEKLSKYDEKTEKKSQNFAKIQLFFDEFIKNIKNGDLKFVCDKVAIIDNSAKKLVDFDYNGELFYFVEIDDKEILSFANQNYFIAQKKGLF